jgi:hypothetical protein
MELTRSKEIEDGTKRAGMPVKEILVVNQVA